MILLNGKAIRLSVRGKPGIWIQDPGIQGIEAQGIETQTT